MAASPLRQDRWPLHGLVVLLAVVAPLAYLFTAQPRLASFGSDAASYLTLANYFLGASGNPFAAAWAPYHSHFPPLLPLLLAASGGALDYRIAHALVAAMGVLALPLLYRYAGRQLRSAGAGLLVVVLFVATPTAWISLMGILSEPLFLLLVMATLVFFDERLSEGRGGAFEYVLFGILLAAAFLSRVLGVALLLAYVAHCAVALASRRERFRARLLAPLVPWIVLVGLWYALRPVAGMDSYDRTALGMLTGWRGHPLLMLHRAAAFFVSGWVASFMGQGDVSAPVTIALSLLGLLALGGLAARIAANRLDAWFVVASLVVIFPWVFSAENTRRLLYPLLPVLVLCAADLLSRLARRWSLPARRRVLVFGAVAAAQLLLSLPAMVLLASKSTDREPVIPGYGYRYRDVTEYYTTINLEDARKSARVVVATLAGLESLARVTPPDAAVMWMRPEYVALLGHRRAVPFLYRWDRRKLAAEVMKSGADYVVVCWIYKTDLAGEAGDPLVDTKPYAHPVLVLGGGDVFTLMKVDRQALARYLAGGS